MLIASVAELLQERKIVIVPDRSLNRVPYASVSDKDEKYLTENSHRSLFDDSQAQESSGNYHHESD